MPETIPVVLVKYRYFGLPGELLGRESLLRENEAELKYPLLAKRCAWGGGRIPIKPYITPPASPAQPLYFRVRYPVGAGQPERVALHTKKDGGGGIF